MAFADDGGGYLAIAGSEARCVRDAAGTKGNALFSEGGSGLYTFIFRGPPGAWVGVSTAEQFAAGWKLKGLFYGGPGNLSDGSGLLSGGWGPEFGEGDRVAMRLEQEGNRASLAFSKNGTPLGAAFDIEGWSGGVLRPCVCLDTLGQGVALEGGGAAGLPPLPAFLRARSDEGVEGEWAGRFALKVSSVGQGAWSLAAKVGNTLACRVERAGEGGAVRLAGGVRSTMMMPPPDVLALEQEALRMLEGVTALRREGAELLVLSGGGATERFAAAQSPAPVQREHVHWMQ